MTTDLADHPVISPKKLIEVAMPLDAINAACAREKSIRHGHPSTLHLWWARRPLAAARSVIFGQLVHDPEDLWLHQNPGVEPKPQNKSAWTRERARLFKIIEDMVLWENTTNEAVMEKARAEIRRSWKETCDLNRDHPQAAELFNPEKMPGLHDPFAGGGAIPLEAQRLGLEAYASDLNPVAVLINKAMIEIPPKFAGQAPVHPEAADEPSLVKRSWKGAEGLAEDVRRYGEWMRDEAEKRIGHLYPKVEVTREMAEDRPDLEPYVGQHLTVIAWLWARTVKSPNPAYSHVDVPLASTFTLCRKKGRERHLVPSCTDTAVQFEVQPGNAPPGLKAGTKLGRGHFKCVISGSTISADYIRSEGQSGRLGQTLMAIALDTKQGRVYIPGNTAHEQIATSASPTWSPQTEFFQKALGFRIGNYGLSKWSDAFTNRQTLALETLAAQLKSAKSRVKIDALHTLSEATAESYSAAVTAYLALCVSRQTNRLSSLCFWDPAGENVQQVFARQALTMIFDTAEANPFSNSTGNFIGQTEYLCRVLEHSIPARGQGHASQAAAQDQRFSRGQHVSTDPPYYDNIGYADLSDFFYCWLRHMCRHLLPELFGSICTPKEEELVATPHRHGGRNQAEEFFLDGMTEAMIRVANQAHPAGLVSIYYAFKQSETEADDATSSTGWTTFLDAVAKAGLEVHGTWPLRTEYTGNLKGKRNALASSVVLICRRRGKNAGTISRRQFIRQLNEKLPKALDDMTRESEGMPSPVAPVDLSQAIIGPGMAIFSKYDAVLEADGSPMTVKTALQLINRFLAEDDFDSDTQFCLTWFQQHGWIEGEFGEADTLARAKGTSVDGVKEAGVVESGGGKVRLYRWKEYPTDWDPESDPRLPVWEALHHLIRVHATEGDSGAAKVLAGIARQAEPARQLAYRLYTLCERKGWTEDARAYNGVVTGWSGIEQAATRVAKPEQMQFFEDKDLD